TGLGNKAEVQVYTGIGSATTPFQGVAVTATADGYIVSVSVAGSGGGFAGVAGSAAVSILKETTRAWVGKGAQINKAAGSADDLQSVTILAANALRVIEASGGLGGGGTAGVGAGVDVAKLTKITEAYVENGTSASAANRADIAARGDISVGALSDDNIISIAATLGAGGSAGIAGSVGTWMVDITTRAKVGDYSKLMALGNVTVMARADTNLSMIAGSIAGAGAAAIGASVGVSIVKKTTEALIGLSAVIDAKATQAAVSVPTGLFTPSYSQVNVSAVDTGADTITLSGPSAYRTGDAVVYRKGANVVGGLTDGGTYYAIEVAGQGSKVRLATSAENARAGTAINLTSSGNGQIQPLGKTLPSSNNRDISDDGLLSKRKATPELVNIRGVSVVAVNTDTIENLSVAGAAA
ncbi:MAG: hypothetical protein EBY30_18780, partial [Rhodospirillales bacterium]|nr:hypothetical protein [Rhodospirillales bacterium]